jgi:hypothetical protein
MSASPNHLYRFRTAERKDGPPAIYATRPPSSFRWVRYGTPFPVQSLLSLKSSGMELQLSNLTAVDVLPLLILEINDRASDELASLLETKHLYQRVRIPYEDAIAKVRKSLRSSYDEQQYDRLAKDVIQGRFALTQRSLYTIDRSRSELPNQAILVRNVKLFCTICNSAEAYSPIWFRDASNEILSTRASNPLLELPLEGWFQLFVLLYQCQICKSDPVSFIVRRENWHLVLEGRSPMEEVEIPKEIPRAESYLYKDSVIAMQSGKYLAAILYLRVFIEQFGRRQTGINGRETGETILDAYAKQIPEGQRGQMPSLKEQYEKLSEAIHLAKDDKEQYEKSRVAVDEHFELRRLFKLSETAFSVKDGSKKVNK